MVSVEDRIKQLNQIQETVQRNEEQLNELLKYLNWTKDKLPKPKPEKPVPDSDIASTSTEHTKVQTVKKPKDDFDAVVHLCTEISQKQSALNTFTDLNKLKRDLKRRRVKYRTTKSAPLSYTEELRELINLQMEIVQNKEMP